ncbi:MAG TPA: TIGR04290 family methyltransferase [Rhodopila sp.]|jgi:tRNA (mo5U34)-methyltransferase|nr:TIGR04290 family methyltransferase [Rhodopila sp.]
MGDGMGDDLETQIRKLGPWFHNMNLGGVWTAPDHFLGNYPDAKWRVYADALPQDLRGRTVLDIGCNAGFFSMQMKRRGADRVLGIDFDEAYLAQARFAAQVENLDIEFRHMSVYDVGSLGEKFDIVMFIGVFYHLRHPLLALDLIHDHVARDLLIFQSLQRGSPEIAPVAADYDFYEAAHFDDPGYPRMHFIEHRYSGDQTNWWVPNRACTEAMLRSAGFVILSRPEEETYLCRTGPRPDPAYGPVYPARGTERA